jgi:hypothetical protein
MENDRRARANADREETLQLARDMVQSAEDARFAVVEELESLRAALAAEQARSARCSRNASASRRAPPSATPSSRAPAKMIEQLETSRASGAAELARTSHGTRSRRRRGLATQHEYQLAQVQIERLCSAQDDMVEDRAQFVAKLHDAKEREARLRLRIAGLEQRNPRSPCRSQGCRSNIVHGLPSLRPHRGAVGRFRRRAWRPSSRAPRSARGALERELATGEGLGERRDRAHQRPAGAGPHRGAGARRGGVRGADAADAPRDRRAGAGRSRVARRGRAPAEEVIEEVAAAKWPRTRWPRTK